MTNNDALTLEIAQALNRCSAEKGSDTPEFVLAGLLSKVLDAFDQAVHERSQWYGRHDKPGLPQQNAQVAEQQLFCTRDAAGQMHHFSMRKTAAEYAAHMGREPGVVRKMTVRTKHGFFLLGPPVDTRGEPTVELKP